MFLLGRPPSSASWRITVGRHGLCLSRYAFPKNYPAGAQGLEPRLPGPKPGVLPLDDAPILILH